MGEGAFRDAPTVPAPAGPARIIDLRSPEPRVYEAPSSDGERSPRTPTSEDRLRDGIAVMAHEVRGPLLAARAAIEKAMFDVDLPAEGGRLLGRACREIDRVSRHVDRLLRWGARQQEVSVRQVDLMEVVDEAVESCVFETGQDRVRVLRASRPVVDADPDHLRMAVANLVRNALQYSPGDTDVDVCVEVESGLAIVTVTDHGPGILDAERHSIFDPFVRGTAGMRTEGGGIGLFFARSVIDALGGSVRCQSNAGGTAFQVWLPLSEGVASSAS